MAVIMDVKEAVKKIKDGMVIHVGGFYAVGTPEDIIDEMVKQGPKNLTLISNDGGAPDKGVGRLLAAGQVKKLIISWGGRTPLIPELVDKGELELELNPQGTLAERIRAAGYGLGGIITPTGLGTMIEEKFGQRVTFNGQDFLYHTPLKADVAIIGAYRADKAGNIIFRRSQRNFCEIMAMAADLTIAQVYKPIEEMGALDPDEIMVPGPLVDILVQQTGEERVMWR